MKYKTKPKHRRNLAILALGLKNQRPSRKFNMEWFANQDPMSDVGPNKIKEKIKKCGTSACAAGWGPIFGISAKKREGWYGYVKRSFGDSEGMFDTCFECRWPNSPKHAAKRIAWWLTTEKELTMYPDNKGHSHYYDEPILVNEKEFEKFSPDWTEIKKISTS